MISRFDRQADGQRVPFISALTALGAADGESRSYIELVEVLRRDGAAAAEDAAQLWRRMVFNVLISNTDDHLRNHGYLRTPAGWRLAPAYDLNPVPTDVKPRIHSLALDEIHDEASLDTALEAAPAFGLTHAEASEIATAVGAAVAGWREVAAQCGLNAAQIERVQSAFEHQDLQKATGAPSRGPRPPPAPLMVIEAAPAINRLWWEHFTPGAMHGRRRELEALLRKWCATDYGAHWLAPARGDTSPHLTGIKQPSR